MGAVLESLNSVKEVIEDVDEASKESSEVTINIISTFSAGENRLKIILVL